MRIRKLSIALVTAALGVIALGAMPALGADHRDSPLTKDSPKADIGDFYVWKLPNGNVVYAMTVWSGWRSEGTAENSAFTLATAFAAVSPCFSRK